MSLTEARLKFLEKEFIHLKTINAELLAACKKALQWDPDGNMTMLEYKNALRAAIAKAQGEK